MSGCANCVFMELLSVGGLLAIKCVSMSNQKKVNLQLLI